MEIEKVRPIFVVVQNILLAVTGCLLFFGVRDIYLDQVALKTGASFVVLYFTWIYGWKANPAIKGQKAWLLIVVGVLVAWGILNVLQGQWLELVFAGISALAIVGYAQSQY